MAAEKINRPVFMIGMPRSGTTVLSEAFALHDDLAWFSNYYNRLSFLPGIGALERFAKAFNLRGGKKQDNSFVASVRRFYPHTDEAWNVWKKSCGSRFLYEYLIKEIAAPEEKERICSHIRRVLHSQHKDRFFTKLTGPPRIHYLKSIFPDGIFIHIVRDPRAVIASLKRVVFWQQYGLDTPWWKNGLPDEYIAEWEGSGRLDAVLAAIQWKRVVELVREEKNELDPAQFLEIRYEDFVADPCAILSSLFSKTGLSPANVDLSSFNKPGLLKNMNYKFVQELSRQELEGIATSCRETASFYRYLL